MQALALCVCALSSQLRNHARGHVRPRSRHRPPRPDVANVNDPKTLADRIEDLLPQTQCTKCGYDGCRPYAEAVAAGTANYNQ
ncbi:(Fe-S)-binding protein, partial [Paraburkholderia sp.]|uniref:(Fe-S)-binding protein n=1 Tax=Paraburkholderia sp. TaxID=1926495 RepID=UPI0039C9F8F7